MNTSRTTIQRDRAAGALVGLASGDAVGAGYEFDPPMAAGHPVAMIGGGPAPFQPGEWTDGTSMAIAIAEIAATGADLRHEDSLDYIAERWHWWSRTAKGIDTQTATVLSMAGSQGISAQMCRRAAQDLHERIGRSGGDRSLMRTAPVALSYLDDEDALVVAARLISELTHFHPEAGDACVLWCLAIRHAVLTGDLEVRIGLPHIPSGRRDTWAARVAEAEQAGAYHFALGNERAASALQAAWAAVVHTPTPTDDPVCRVFRADHLRLAIETAARARGHTNTVAAIAGGLVGAAYGASAVPWHWRLTLKGWPGLNTRGLVKLANLTVEGGDARTFAVGYRACRNVPRPVRHPDDDALWLGAAPSLHSLPAGIDAVVSLCPVEDGHIPAGVVHLHADIGCSNRELALLDSARAVEALRAQGRTVFAHGATATNRAPAVAVLYAARCRGRSIDAALDGVRAVMSDVDMEPALRRALHVLHPAGGGGR
ncbi:ADP-ribosylglycohydrolase family protein [Mycolicibacterium vanbaalenii]|uniref:ADP-ribosylation/Crystallin J1 n=1 Tax=Mycolicibacterium vanbaalenii (strain DSM 7251 / JCM 13017 / BCRC 16820 / KCTC 9966 / NRRL B-24157 / PYR-1) TaxID=350058 RepID=A1T442_MYCVP|nr:ADP-ribosylglycohydrolase family protein [Mycolicibacterium vanbaalenii]ABM11942.1 ADP-ribosylation/Crystallin J1 [Mycolicibacterium vanbaalenii PYR-1]MCV7130022.1 ADP-ribosylglycohydrolase family protein [Mycolicibacterium vanbaalenii PYR-1]